MKKTLTILLGLLISASVWAQIPDKMSYQAVIRDAGNAIVANQSVGMQISILQGSASGLSVYTETHTATSNVNGLVSIEIGNGASSDDFSAIDWSADTYFVKTETDPAGGTNYTITGTSQLLSVPYALYAKTAESIAGGITETDPTYSSSEAANITSTDITNLGNLSGSNTGDQDISGIATNASDISTNASDIANNTTAIALNTAQTVITTAQANAITANTAKVGLTAEQTTILSNTSGTNTGDQDLSSYLTSEIDGSVTNEIELPTSGNPGDMNYWNGSAWVTIPTTPNEAAALQMISGVPTWTGGTPPPAIGDFRDGGVVFWLDGSGGGLVCAVSDQSSSIQWYNGSYTTTGATGTEVETGQANTTAIIANQGATETNYAAGLAKAYAGGGYNDWYLPSQDELNEMYLNKATIDVTAINNGGDGFDITTQDYWSSTEDGSLNAWGLYFGGGFPTSYSKSASFGHVRAVRAF